MPTSLLSENKILPVEKSNDISLADAGLPVTLLSGFLGAGKTTLLKYILANKQDLKCAVIVNDMASLNIDASLIEKSAVLQKEEKLVKFQNGCICCTLRGDLLAEVARLAESGEFDYLVIESTGISEPMQVAETFAMNVEDIEQLGAPDEGQPLKSLAGLAHLDTCVTVVDCTQIFDLLDTAQFLGQKFKDAEADDDRTVSDLLCDQIEFANLILLNKIDMVSSEEIERCECLIRAMNPKAEIIRTRHSRLDLSRILNTKKFDYEEAMMSPGWLLSLRESHTPETVEYGISSFVYHARLPFHPQRLYDLLHSNFLLMEMATLEGDDGEEEEEWEDMNDENKDDDMSEGIEDEPVEIDQEIVKKRLAKKKKSCFKNLFRSKGFLWIATRPKNQGEWSQAGVTLSIGNGGNWFTDLPKSMWPQDPEVSAKIERDFDPQVGDKRQELVFIGQFTDLDKTAISAALDKCLVTSKEYKLVKRNMFDSFEDPWEEWNYFSEE